MYSELFGLQLLNEEPAYILKGTFSCYDEYRRWFVCVGKDATGYKWDAVIKGALPKQAHLEALLLGIQL